mmetsp:Transcript_3387/g.10297  ORF Transcript_3387/g.10297 Transcript_3387/m.10297 type:complete len:98 (+) Transcript_3387:96-389(+)
MKCWKPSIKCWRPSNPISRDEKGRLTLSGNTFREWGEVILALTIFYAFYVFFFWALLQVAFAVREKRGTFERPGTVVLGDEDFEEKISEEGEIVEEH